MIPRKYQFGTRELNVVFSDMCRITTRVPEVYAITKPQGSPQRSQVGNNSGDIFTAKRRNSGREYRQQLSHENAHDCCLQSD